jgi:Mn-dependent DtxR family transcriptional regulator
MNMEKLLKQASNSLGIEPGELKSLLSKGDVNAIMEKMNDKDAKRLKDALADPDTVKHFKNSPEMAKYMDTDKKEK